MESSEPKPKSTIRRWRLALASVLIAGLLLYFLLPTNAGAYRAMPAQSSLVLEGTGLLRAQMLCEKTADPQWREWLHSKLFKTCFADADAAIKLLAHDPGLLRAFAKNKCLAAFTLHPSDSLHALFALELDERINLENLLKTSKLASKFFPHQFRGNTIFNVHLSKTEQIEVAVRGKILLCSRRAILVEDALAQLDNARNWWADRPYLNDLPPSPLRIHLRPGAMAEQFRNSMNARWRSLPDLLARNVEWLGMSWNGESVKILAETKGFVQGLASWGKASDNEIFKILPDNTAFMARAGLKDIPAFFNEIGAGRNTDFDQYVLPWLGSEAALVVTEPLSPALTADRLLLLAVRDSARAVSSLRAFGNDRGTLPGASGAYQMFELWGFQNSSLLKPLLGDDENFRNPVAALAGGFAIFAPDRSSLEIFLDKYLVNQTLAAQVDFLQLQQKFSADAPASFLLHTAYWEGLFHNILEDSVEDFFPEKENGRFIAAELVPDFGKKAKVSVCSQPLSQGLPETDIVWKTPLPFPVITQPYLIEQGDGGTVALVQDSKNQLYCLDARSGEILWSKALEGRILSRVQGFDYYGNGSKCCFFNTAAQIFALDESGRTVDGYPFKLPSAATNGVTVIDFDHNNILHFFVACDNGNIYGFGHSGKPLEGWNALPAQGKVLQPILHFQHKGKDFLAILTETGRLAVLGRDGNLRFPAIQLDGQFNIPLQAGPASPSPRIYCANTKGQLFSCDLQGKIRELPMAKPGSLCAFGQLSGDAGFEWAALAGKNLRVGAGADLLFETRFPENQQQVFFAPGNRLGTVDKRGRRIWMLDSKGKSVAGFPLGGNTEFAFCRQNELEILVVGNGKGVWAYRMR